MVCPRDLIWSHTALCRLNSIVLALSLFSTVAFTIAGGKVCAQRCGVSAGVCLVARAVGVLEGSVLIERLVSPQTSCFEQSVPLLLRGEATL